jgi:hypothetical protein
MGRGDRHENEKEGGETWDRFTNVVSDTGLSITATGNHTVKQHTPRKNLSRNTA